MKKITCQRSPSHNYFIRVARPTIFLLLGFSACGVISTRLAAAPLPVDINVLGAENIRATPALSPRVPENRSGFFQHESLYTFAQDRQTTELWFCHSTAKLGLQCVSAQLIPNRREIGWKADRSSATTLAHHSLGIQSSMLVMSK